MKLNLSWMYSSTIHRISIHWLIYPACILESWAMSAFIRTNKNDPGILGAPVAFLRVLLLSEHWETLSWDLENWRVMIFMRPLKESRFPDWDPDLNIISKFGRIKSHRCIRSKTEESRTTWMGVGLWWKRKVASITSPDSSWNGNAQGLEMLERLDWVLRRFEFSLSPVWTAGPFTPCHQFKNHLVDMGNSKPANKKLYKQGSNHVKTY